MMTETLQAESCQHCGGIRQADQEWCPSCGENWPSVVVVRKPRGRTTATIRGFGGLKPLVEAAYRIMTTEPGSPERIDAMNEARWLCRSNRATISWGLLSFLWCPICCKPKLHPEQAEAMTRGEEADAGFDAGEWSGAHWAKQWQQYCCCGDVAEQHAERQS